MCATQPLLVAISKRVYKKSESKWCWDFGVREAQNYIRNGVYLECGWNGCDGSVGELQRITNAVAYYGLLRRGGGLALHDDGIFFFVEMGKMAAQYGRRRGWPNIQ